MSDLRRAQKAEQKLVELRERLDDLADRWSPKPGGDPLAYAMYGNLVRELREILHGKPRP